MANTIDNSDEAVCGSVAPATPSSTSRAQCQTEKHAGVSTNCAHWYALRTTYGREQKAYDYMVAKGATVFLPTITSVRLVDGKRRTIVESRLPNIFFAYGTEDQLKGFVYDNVNLPFLRFYYRKFTNANGKADREPMIVPQRQMNSLMIICRAESDDVFVSGEEIRKFRKGQLVRITGGEFTGVVGRVTRFKGQQRVGLYIDGLLTIATAFVPSKYLEIIDEGMPSSQNNNS